MLYSPITAMALARAIQSDRLAEAEDVRRARLGGSRHRSPPGSTPVMTPINDPDLGGFRPARWSLARQGGRKALPERQQGADG